MTPKIKQARAETDRAVRTDPMPFVNVRRIADERALVDARIAKLEAVAGVAQMLIDHINGRGFPMVPSDVDRLRRALTTLEDP